MKKLTYKYVKKQIESVNEYKLLSTEYINSKTKLKVQCDKGHIYKVRYGNFQQGKRCPYCAGLLKLEYDFVKKQIENIKGYKLISKKYINNKTRLKIKCDKGHIYETNWRNFQQGYRCLKCVKLDYKYVKEQIESVKDYKLLSTEYINNYTKLKVQCNKGHKYKTTYANFQQGYRCSICSYNKKSSKAEKEIVKIIKFVTDELIIENDRTQIINPKTGHNLELDIWTPDLKKAIEFNGEYWHNNDYSKYKNNIKVKQCKEKGIDLLVINERDWLDDKNEQINRILSAIKNGKKEIGK